MFKEFKDALLQMKEGIVAEVSKITNVKFLEAAIGGCVIVAAADKVLKSEEKAKMMKFVKTNESLKHFDSDTAVDLFNKYAKALEFDFDFGLEEIYAVIRKFKGKDEARILVRLYCTIGASDGDFDADEKQAVRNICKELALDPADFGL